MTLQDGPKRHGKFLKKGSSVFNKVSLVEFKFQEMVPTSTITHDNAKRTIIHADFHDKETLENSLKKHDKMDLDLIAPEDRPSIIIPRDFTADWEKDRSLRKRKITRFDDDDYDLDFETVRKNTGNAEVKTSESEVQKTDKGAPSPPPKPTNEPQVNTQQTTPWETMEVVGKAINNLQSKESSQTATNSHIPIQVLPSQPKPHQDRPRGEQSSHEDASPGEKVTSIEASDFTSVSPHNEEAALRTYQKQQLELAKMKEDFESQMSALLEQEKTKAYKDGFMLGEEKAEQQVREKAQDLFKNVANLVTELTQLKFSILNNVQENFYTICQAIGEALVKREFSIHPETFAEVLRRAMAETIQPTNLKILVHPEMYEKLLKLHLPDINNHLSKDSSLDISGFRLESHLSVIDGNISEMIGKMLKQADLEIFDKTAETSDKERKTA